MDQFTVISNILDHVEKSDLVSCFHVNKNWNVLSSERLRQLPKWKQTDLKVQKQFQPLESQTTQTTQTVENCFASLFCPIRGVYFKFYVHGNKSLRIQTLNHFCDTRAFLTQISLRISNFDYIIVPPIFTKDSNFAFFIKMDVKQHRNLTRAPYFIDCTNLTKIKFCTQIAEADLDLKTIAWHFFGLCRPKFDNISDLMFSTPNLNPNNGETCVHLSIHDPLIFHLVIHGEYTSSNKICTFRGSQVVHQSKNFFLDVEQVNIADEIICGNDYYLVVENDDTSHIVTIVNFKTNSTVKFSFWYDTDPLPELCPLTENCFMILFQKESICDYRIIDIKQLKEICQGSFKIWKLDEFKFRQKCLIQPNLLKLCYLNDKHQLTEFDYSFLK